MKLSAAVDTYVLRRHAMGQKFEGPAATLRAFSLRYSNSPLKGIAPADVKQFLDVPQTGAAAWRRKYGVLRDFFTYWRYRGKLNAVPLPPPVPRHTPTFVPYIFSRRELRLLLDAAPCCQRRAACRTSAITLRTLLLFLYGTGVRMGEALRLRLADVDLDYGVVTIRGTKFYKSRLVPMGSDVVQLLRKYLASSGRWNQHYQPLFQSRQHKSLGHSTIDANFRRLCILAGVRRSDASYRQPRLHDLRHTFAVHRLTEWYRTGANALLTDEPFGRSSIYRMIDFLETAMGDRIQIATKAKSLLSFARTESIWLAAAPVKVQDELAALDLDGGPRQPNDANYPGIG